jgi:hypothetical protein
VWDIPSSTKTWVIGVLVNGAIKGVIKQEGGDDCTVECKQRRDVNDRVDWVINPIDVDINTYERFQKASIKSYKLN